MAQLSLKKDRSIILLLEGYARESLNDYASQIFSSEANILEHPDFHVLRPIEGAKQISIDQVRFLQQRLSRKPAIHHRHMVLIDLVEMLSLSATNSLLKLLEEPEGLCLGILLTQNIARVLPTIKSRCFQIKLPVVPQSRNLAKYLDEIYPTYSLSVAAIENWYMGQYDDSLPFSAKEQVDVIMIMLSYYLNETSNKTAFNVYEKLISFKKSLVFSTGLDELLIAGEAQSIWANIRGK